MRSFFIIMGAVFVLGIAFIAKLAEAKDKTECELTCETSTFSTEAYEICLKDCKPGGKKKRVNPCKDQPGTKYCKITKSCIPVADFATLCVDRPWCASSNDGNGGFIAPGEDCLSCFEIGMMTAPDGRSCIDPCTTDGVLIFSCMSWCPSLNDGHGGFIRAVDYDALCGACEFGDNGIRCLSADEAGRHDELITAIAEAKAAGGVDLAKLYILITFLGFMIFLVVILRTMKSKNPKKPQKPAATTQAKTPAANTETEVVDEPTETK